MKKRSQIRQVASKAVFVKVDMGPPPANATIATTGVLTLEQLKRLPPSKPLHRPPRRGLSK
jgi:hypothetical protein